MAPVRLRALRGATTVEANEADAILEATEELVATVLERNGLEVDDLVSCIFTCTTDLNAEFPAVAARRIGLSSGAADLRPRDGRARGAAARDPADAALLRRARTASRSTSTFVRR